MIGFLTAPLRIGIEKVPDEVSHVYKLTFPKIACRLFCWFSGDANDFHNHWKDANACVPGAMIFSGVGAIVSKVVPLHMIGSTSGLFFRKPILLGGSVLVQIVMVRSDNLTQHLTVRIYMQSGEDILKRVTLVLVKRK